jgi:hypothetical protein
VPGALRDDKLDGVTAGPRRGGVVAAYGHRNAIVALTVDQQLEDAEEEPLPR